MRNLNDEELMKRVLESIFNGTDNAVYILNPDELTILYMNDRMKLLTNSGLDVIGRTCHECFNKRNLPCLNCPVIQVAVGEIRTVRQYVEIFEKHMFQRVCNITWIDGSRALMCTVLNADELVTSDSKMKKARDLVGKDNRASDREKLRLIGELYSTVVAQSNTIVFEYNYRENTYYASPLLEERFGINKVLHIDFTLDEDNRKIIYGDDIEKYQQLFKNEDKIREVTCRFIEKNNRIVWYKVTIQTMYDSDGKRVRAIGTMKDVDEATRSYEALRYRADYDLLTGLPNASKFYQDVFDLIVANLDKKYAIVVFDIEKFKMINDLFDMSMGDEVLQFIGDILRVRMPEDSVYARIHSDVFCICFSYVTKGDVIRQIEKLKKAIFNNGFSFDLNTTYGIYLPENPNIPVNLMCDRALLANKTIKGNVVKFCAFYDEQYRADIIRNREIEQDMEAALREGQFKMYLQPKVNLKTEAVVGAEVLARWQHPVKGLIQPNDFIPLFERNGFILKLDEFMWEEACKAVRKWLDEGRHAVPLAVNISRYHIENNDLVKVITNLVRKYDIDPSMLILEITETVFTEKIEELYEVLIRLEKEGFHLEVDDFGSGYSSLNMLRNVPVDTIKIDRNFLDKQLSNKKGKIVVSHTIAMAKDLKLQVIAEGVETREHVEFLQESECDIAQGFYFARPMPYEEFDHLTF